jgi:flavin-dependent dehydrogenase
MTLHSSIPQSSLRLYDAAILGGGLAGLTLARQLHLEAPHIRVLVVEKRKHPVREAAHKVGESSVEIGAHYFQHVLRLEPHLRAKQLEKLGLRYFFPQGDNRDLARRVELGPPVHPPVPSFQLDRGRLENHLLEELRASGVEVVDDCSVKTIAIEPRRHSVTIESKAGGTRTVHARYLADASGRSGLLKRKLGLAREADHGANASWFRVPERVRVDDWSADPAWQARVPSGQRWLSTNHLMGRGYWVWLIPLGNGSTSIGIVADGDLHPYSRINRFDRALDWLREFEPQCAAVVERYADRLEDFLALKHYAHGCARVHSPDGWSLVGESGVFTDPFYSPGSDFIAIGNDFAADLIVRTAAGAPVDELRERAEAFNTTHLRLFDAFLRLYSHQYPLMGNAQVMTAKAAWDNGAYWAIPAPLYFQRRYTNLAFMESIDTLMRRFFVLHARLQQLFHAWDLADQPQYEDAAANVISVDDLRRLQGSLTPAPMDDESLRRLLEENLTLLEAFARSWQALASERNPALPRYVDANDGPRLDITPLVLQPVGVAL